MKAKRSQHSDVIQKYRSKMEELDNEEESKRVEKTKSEMVSSNKFFLQYYMK